MKNIIYLIILISLSSLVYAVDVLNTSMSFQGRALTALNDPIINATIDIEFYRNNACTDSLISRTFPNITDENGIWDIHLTNLTGFGYNNDSYHIVKINSNQATNCLEFRGAQGIIGGEDIEDLTITNDDIALQADISTNKSKHLGIFFTDMLLSNILDSLNSTISTLSTNISNANINGTDINITKEIITGFNTGDILSSEIDLDIGTDFGAIEIGNTQIFQSSLTIAGLNLDGTTVFRNTESNSLIEFLFATSDNLVRLAIPISAPDLAIFNPRSMMIGGDLNQAFNSNIVNCSSNGYARIDCNTDATGADLGIQDDLQVRGFIYGSEGINLNDSFNVTKGGVNMSKDLNVGGRILMSDGLESSPSLRRESIKAGGVSGLYWEGSTVSRLYVVIDGSQIWRFSANLFEALDSNAQIQIPDGTEANPSLVSTADTNTGYYFPSAGKLALSLDGIELVRFDGVSSTVGIGTKIPTQTLTVSGNTSILGDLNVSQGLNVNDRFNVTKGGVNMSKNLIISGRVGIGTPTTSYKLEVVDVETTNAFGVNISAIASSAPNRAEGIKIYVQGSGATAPGTYAGYFEADDRLAGAGTKTYGVFANATDAETNYGIYATASGGTNNYAGIFDQGNVGIGTTRPSQLLDVNGSLIISNSSGRIFFDSVLTSDMSIFSGNRFMVFNVPALGNAFSGGYDFRIDDQSNDEAVFKISASGDVLLYINATENGKSSTFRFGDEDLPNKFFIDDSGNVGIGTIAPTHTLNVVGDANISTDLTVDGDTTLTGELTGSIHRFYSSFDGTSGSTYLNFETGLPMSSSEGYIPDAAGSIIGVSWISTSRVNGPGGFNLNVKVNDAIVFTATTTLADSASGTATQAKATDTFSAGDDIQVQIIATGPAGDSITDLKVWVTHTRD